MVIHKRKGDDVIIGGSKVPTSTATEPFNRTQEARCLPLDLPASSISEHHASQKTVAAAPAMNVGDDAS
jgi:hypothetical protein